MSTDIEKKSLEAHVDLCAERYKNLNDKLDSLEKRMDKVENYLLEIKNTIISTMSPKSHSNNNNSDTYKTMITIGTTILGALIGAIITLIIHLK